MTTIDTLRSTHTAGALTRWIGVAFSSLAFATTAFAMSPPEPPIVVSATVTAEWKLDGKDPAKLIVDAHELQGKVKAADLAGTKQKSEEASEEEQELVSVIIGMARALGMIAIAEGVESEDQMMTLRRLGCDAAQGFYIGKPQPAERVEDYLPAGHAPAHS